MLRNRVQIIKLMCLIIPNIIIISCGSQPQSSSSENRSTSVPSCDASNISQIILSRYFIGTNESTDATINVSNRGGRIVTFTWSSISGDVNPTRATNQNNATYHAPPNELEDTISVVVSIDGCAPVTRSAAIQVVSNDSSSVPVSTLTPTQPLISNPTIVPPAESTSTQTTDAPTVAPIDTPTEPSSTLTVVASTAALTGTAGAPSGALFDFETNGQGWDTSEYQYKLAEVDQETTVAHSGQGSLRLTTVLTGSADKLYQSTEAKVYFSQAASAGVDIPDELNLKGKTVSCYVYMPTQLIASRGSATVVAMFVKDINEANDSAPEIVINAGNTNKWYLLQLKVAVKDRPDHNFDATHVKALGVKFKTLPQSTLKYSGSPPIYIDDCTIN